MSLEPTVAMGYQWIVVTIVNIRKLLIPLTDWAHNAHSLTVQRGQNAHYVPSLQSKRV